MLAPALGGVPGVPRLLSSNDNRPTFAREVRIHLGVGVDRQSQQVVDPSSPFRALRNSRAHPRLNTFRIPLPQTRGERRSYTDSTLIEEHIDDVRDGQAIRIARSQARVDRVEHVLGWKPVTEFTCNRTEYFITHCTTCSRCAATAEINTSCHACIFSL